MCSNEGIGLIVTKAILNSLYFSGLDRVCAPFTRGVGNIWMLHRVNNNPIEGFCPNAHLSVTPEFLDSAILNCKVAGYRFVSMDELVAMKGDGVDEPVIAVTLDDGYRDNLENAIPVFRRHGVPYTIFVAPGLVEGSHTLWWEDLEAIIRQNRKITLPIEGNAITFNTEDTASKQKTFAELINLLRFEVEEDEQRNLMEKLSTYAVYDASAHVSREILGWEELTRLADDPLCTLGAHTIGHYAVARLDRERARFEMAESQRILEKKLGREVTHFAYPYGCERSAGDRDAEIASEIGFHSAVTTRHGVLDNKSMENPHLLPRVSLNGWFQSIRYLRPLMSGVPAKLNNLATRLKAA